MAAPFALTMELYAALVGRTMTLSWDAEALPSRAPGRNLNPLSARLSSPGAPVCPAFAAILRADTTCFISIASNPSEVLIYA